MMKNKHLVLFMALIMCFSLVFGAAAANEGEQIIPTSAVSPTQEEDFIDGIGGMLGDVAGDKFDQAGSVIEDGIGKAHGFLGMFQNLVENIKIFFANLINTIFPFFNIGDGNSILG